MEKVKTIINVVTFGSPQFSDFSNAATTIPSMTRGGYNFLVSLLERRGAREE